MLTKADIQEVVAELEPYLAGMSVTEKALGKLPLTHIDTTPILQRGSQKEVLNLLQERFCFLNEDLPLPPGWEVGIGLIDDQMQDGVLHVTWRVHLIGAGAFNVPHNIIRRGEDAYEILMPE